MLVLIVVVLIVLPNGVRRVADNDADVGGVQSLKPLLVLTKSGGEDVLHAVLGERIGPDEHVVGRVGFLRADLVEDALKIHRRDVVSEWHDLVCVEVVSELGGELFGGNDAGLHHAREEGPGPCEGIENVHALL